MAQKHHRWFHDDILKKLHRKLWKISRKTCSCHLTKLHDYGLQLTTGLKPFQTLFWKCSESKRCSKISKIPKSLSRTASSSQTLQACSLEYFRLQQNRLQEKCSPLVFRDSWKYAKKRSIMESFYQRNKITI